jgi:restriction endonuclease S subunit
MANRRPQTKTGGGAETKGHVSGLYSLAVGMPPNPGPDGWTWTKLSDVARLETGHTPSRRHPEYWDGDIPWIGIRDATANHGQTLLDTNQHTNDLGIANSSARMLPKNTVCLSRTASVGYVVVMGRPMATSQDFVNWVCSERIDHQFLKYILLSENRSFASFASGTTHQTIYFPEVKGFHVCLPSIGIQRKIASILSAYDDLIENNTRRIAVLEEMAQAIYREWFVNFRFPGHENVKLVDSPLGQIPEGWEVSELQQLVSFANGKSIKPGGEGEYLVFGSNGTIGHSDEFRYQCGIVIGRVGAYCGSIAYSPQPFWASDNTIVALSQHDDSFIPFVLYMLKEMNLNRHAGGAAQPLLTQTTLKKLKIVSPPNAIIETFCDFVVPLLLEKSCLENKNDNLRNTSDLLLPKLISGKLNVVDLDIDVGEPIETLEEATA